MARGIVHGLRTIFCTASAEEPHPHYGNGLKVVQSFAAHGKSPSEGAKLALSLNKVELTQRPFG